MNSLRKILSSAFSLEKDKASNEEIREIILSGANIKGTNMFILIMAIFIASIGLNMNSTAVIIGAMLISPLMGGIIAIGYGMATNDLKLVRKAFFGLLFQIIICVITSTIYFTITPISTARSEILARTTPAIWDVLIAFVGGLAGIVGITRKEKSNVIPGVAIATALMPPLCTAGYGIAVGEFKYFAGAFYLFFINSFFICVSTFIIIRLMHIPKRSFIDAKAEKRVKMYIYIIGIITVIPSVFLGYQIVREGVRESNIASFIEKELKWEETRVVSKYVDKNKNTLEVALLGKRVGQESIEVLNGKLKDYGLEDMKLNVTQGESVQTLKTEDIQSIVEQELFENNQQIALGNRDEQIELLKAELVKYKGQLMEYEQDYYDVKILTEELQTLYPDIKTLSVGKSRSYNEEKDEIVEGIVALIETTKGYDEAEQEKLRNWIKVKTGTEEAVLIVKKVVPVEDKKAEDQQTTPPTTEEDGGR